MEPKRDTQILKETAKAKGGKKTKKGGKSEKKRQKKKET